MPTRINNKGKKKALICEESKPQMRYKNTYVLKRKRSSKGIARRSSLAIKKLKDGGNYAPLPDFC